MLSTTRKCILIFEYVERLIQKCPYNYHYYKILNNPKLHHKSIYSFTFIWLLYVAKYVFDFNPLSFYLPIWKRRVMFYRNSLVGCNTALGWAVPFSQRIVRYRSAICMSHMHKNTKSNIIYYIFFIKFDQYPEYQNLSLKGRRCELVLWHF